MSLDIALIGSGRMGRRHLTSIQSIGHRVSGVVDFNQSCLALAQSENGIPFEICHSNPDALYFKGVPDALVIATTADSHHSLVIDAARRGVKFILVEKPMAVSVKQCQEMASECESHGARLAVNHQIRFMGQYQKLKEKITAEEFGGFSSLTVNAGNIGIAMNTSHLLEALRFFSGSEIKEVCAWLSKDQFPNPRGNQYQDRAGCMRAITRNGCRLYVDASPEQHHGLTMNVFGRYGYMNIDLCGGKLVSRCRKVENRPLSSAFYDTPCIEHEENIQPAEVIYSSAEMLRSLISGQGYMNAWEGEQIVRCLVAAHESSDFGGVPVEPGCLKGQLDTVFPWA
jgi:hypothetical protein